jgi:hypothetical protein
MSGNCISLWKSSSGCVSALKAYPPTLTLYSEPSRFLIPHQGHSYTNCLSLRLSLNYPILFYIYIIPILILHSSSQSQRTPLSTRISVYTSRKCPVSNLPLPRTARQKDRRPPCRRFCSAGSGRSWASLPQLLRAGRRRPRECFRRLWPPAVLRRRASRSLQLLLHRRFHARYCFRQ